MYFEDRRSRQIQAKIDPSEGGGKSVGIADRPFDELNRLQSFACLAIRKIIQNPDFMAVA